MKKLVKRIDICMSDLIEYACNNGLYDERLDYYFEVNTEVAKAVQEDYEYEYVRIDFKEWGDNSVRPVISEQLTLREIMGNLVYFTNLIGGAGFYLNKRY